MTVPDASRHLISSGEQYAHYTEMDWLDAGTTYGGHVIDVTDDYSAAASFFVGYKSDGVWRFKVYKDGSATIFRDLLVVGGTEAALVAQSGRVFTNAGIGAPAQIDLPGATAGLTYTAVVMAAQAFGFNAVTGDVIRLLCAESASGGTVLSENIGDSITLLAVDSGTWVAISALGTWEVT